MNHSQHFTTGISILIFSDDLYVELPPSITVSEELSTPIDPDDVEQYFKHFGVDSENQSKGQSGDIVSE